MSVNFKVLQERLFNRVHRTGEEIKNDFPNILRECVKAKAWEHFKRADGTKFKTLGEWLVYAFPNGVSMGDTKDSISYEDALQLCKHDRELHGMLVKHRPSKTGGKRGRPTKEQENSGVPTINRHHNGTRAYIEQRLQRDHKDIYQKYVTGEIKSARQAGIAAGFIKDTHDPVMRLKAYWRKASKSQREEFKRWLLTKEAK